MLADLCSSSVKLKKLTFIVIHVLVNRSVILQLLKTESQKSHWVAFNRTCFLYDKCV